MIRLAFMSLAFGNTFMVRSAWISALFWLAIVRDIRFPIFAIVGLGVADGIAWVLRMDEQVKRGGCLRNNAIFASLAVAWLTTASGLSLEKQFVLELGAAICASLISAALVRGLRDTILPPLGWGFYLTAGTLFTLFSAWAQSALVATVIWPRPHDALSWVTSLFQSLGMMLFLPKVEVGIIVFIAILLWSRLMLLSGIIGWVAGVAIGLALEQMGLNYLWLLAAHNYFLAAMVLASVLFLPGRSVVAIAVVAGVGASVISAYFQYLLPGSAYAFLPVPAALTIWMGVAALLVSGDGVTARRNLESKVPPEVAWWSTAYWTEQFGHNEALFIVPVPGQVQITQGFDGQLSHIGRWRHALDFQRPSSAEAPTIWEAPIYAPAAGYVETVRSNVADNPLGQTNFAEMWGNYIIIRLDAGGWALLSHLRQGSIALSVGMRVETGTYLGLVGNSGRSPTPHLHLHAQGGPAASASTRPFRLANFLAAAEGAASTDLRQWHAAKVPSGGMIIAGATANPATHDALTAMAPGKMVWQVENNGDVPRAFRRYRTGSAVRLRVFLDEFGRHIFRSAEDGYLTTTHSPDAWRIAEIPHIDCPLLKLLAFGTPSIPYAAFPGLTWHEPMPLPPAGPTAWFDLLAAPYRKNPFSYVVCTCRAVPDENGKVLRIESRPMVAGRNLPSKVTIDVERLRGPVRVEAEFQRGSLIFKMFSFEPGMPFERREKQRA